MLRKLRLTKGASMWLPILFGVLAASHVTSVAAAGQPAPATPATYRVISLGSGGPSEKPVINAKGQAAISMDFGLGYSNSMLYDGKTVQNLGDLGGDHKARDSKQFIRADVFVFDRPVGCIGVS